MKVPFSPPRIDQKTIDEVTDTLKSGWITTGPKTKLFEKRITNFCNPKVSLCVNSATAGLELMLRWYGVGKGDEVILPAYTYTATANVIIHCGATPVFVDINSDFNISVQEIKKAVTKNTKVIMPVDLAGYPCDYDQINSLVKSKDIKAMFNADNEVQEKLGRILVLSDSAHSFGATYNKKTTGSLTDISVFSFHAVKNLTTAEGGAVCLNLPKQFDCDKIYKDLCIKTLHGQTKDALAKTKIGSWKYDIIEAGYKFNMTDIQASMGLVELERYKNDTLIKREWVFDKYIEAFKDDSNYILPKYEDSTKKSSFHVFLLRIANASEKQRDEIIQHIFDQEVSVNVHFIPIPMMTFYKNLGYDIKNYPQTYKNYSQEISLPVFYDINEQMIEMVIEAVKKAVKKVL